MALKPECWPREASAGAPSFMAKGPVLRVWSGLNYPRAMARSPAGSLYLVDKSGWIRRYAADGRPLSEVSVPAIAQGTPSAMTWHPTGKLLVADSHYGRILVYSPELELLDLWGELGRDAGRLMLITGIAASSDGRVFVSDQGDDVARVQVFDLQGRYEYAIGRWGNQAGEFVRPMNLAISGERLAVADALNHRVQVFHIDGALQAVLGELGEELGEFKYPYGVSWDRDGKGLWVADFGNHRLQLVDAKGVCQRVFQGAGRAVGGLAYPWCVLQAQGRLFVSDGGNHRIYELRATLLPTH